MLTGTKNIMTLPKGAFAMPAPHPQMTNTQRCTAFANWIQAWKRFVICRRIFYSIWGTELGIVHISLM